MRTSEGSGFLFMALLLLSACDRGPTEDPPEDLPPGTFQAQAGTVSGGGFELMEGPASFEIPTAEEGGTAFLMRLSSLLPSLAVSTTLDFALLTSAVPAPGTYLIGDPADSEVDFAEVFVSCYRSPHFPGDLYRSESGVLTVTGASAGRFEGSFEMVAYTLVQTGPNSAQRTRLISPGTFAARARSTGVHSDVVLEECLTE